MEEVHNNRPPSPSSPRRMSTGEHGVVGWNGVGAPKGDGTCFLHHLIYSLIFRSLAHVSRFGSSTLVVVVGVVFVLCTICKPPLPPASASTTNNGKNSNSNFVCGFIQPYFACTRPTGNQEQGLTLRPTAHWSGYLFRIGFLFLASSSPSSSSYSPSFACRMVYLLCWTITRLHGEHSTDISHILRRLIFVYVAVWGCRYTGDWTKM